MSIKRLEGESFEEYKERRRLTQMAYKIRLRSGRYLYDSAKGPARSSKRNVGYEPQEA